jgi:hypothetical protein
MSHPTFLSGRRSGICAAALLISTSLLLGGCAAGPNSAAKAAETKEEKKVAAVPVEVAVASHRAVAASYTGTAALEPRAEPRPPHGLAARLGALNHHPHHVGGNGEPIPRVATGIALDGRVDAHQFAPKVNECSPRIAWVDGSIGLNKRFHRHIRFLPKDGNVPGFG